MHNKTLFLIGLALFLPACSQLQDGIEREARIDSAQAAREDGDYDRVISDYTEAIRLSPDADYVYTNRGNAWRAKREYDRALADYNEAIRLNPRSVAALVNRGSAWTDLRDYDKALADFNQAVRLGDRRYSTVILHNRAAAYLQKGDTDRAIADYDEAIRYHTPWAASYTNRGTALRAKGEYDRAIADYDDAIRLDPTYARAYLNRGMARLAKGDAQGALADMNVAAKVNPRDTATLNTLAWWYATSKDNRVRNGERALQLARQACEVTHWSLPSYLDTLAAAYAETGNFSDAVTFQEKALQSSGYAKFSGERAQRRLQLYRSGKPYRAE